MTPIDCTCDLQSVFHDMQTELEQLRMVIDAHAIVSITDAYGKITYTNDGFCALSGYNREELIGNSHQMVKSGVHSPAFYSNLWRTISKGETWHGEVCNRRKDGVLYWVKATIVPLRNTRGKPMKYLSMRTDITALKEREIQIEENRKALQLSMHRYQRLVEGFGDKFVVYSHNMASELTFVSAGFTAVTGLPKILALGKSWETLLKWLPQSLERAVANIRQFVRGVSDFAQFDMSFYHPRDGSVRTIRVANHPLRNAAGEVIAVEGLVEDITEHVAMVSELIVARELAERANQAKSDFLSSMSHELRTPMNAILGFSQMLEYDDDLTEDQRDNVQEIAKAGHHLLGLINEVLDLATIESGRINLSMEDVPIAQLAEECCDIVRPLADKREIVMENKLAETIAVFADRARLKQVLINLLSNAIKYNRAGGTIRIATKTCDVPCDRPHCVHLCVIDTGPGISPDRVAHLFQPFNRLGAEHSAVEGTGIGLTICQRLVALMGGEIGVDSTVGVGSTFWIALQASEIEKLERGEATHGLLNVDGQHAHALVLAIDDNPSNLKLIAQILSRRQQIDLRTAHTPELGIELALAERPDLILLDISMPGMDGYQVLAVLKSHPQLSTVPVIAVTANAMPRDVERGRAAGFTDYLTKPLEITHFLRAFDQHFPPAPQALTGEVS